MKGKSIKQAIERCKFPVIIGSSPLLLLSAISLAKKGKRVSIVSELQNWGGSWQYTVHNDSHTDTACHLLESYTAAHAILHSFDIDLQPLKGKSNPIRFIQDFRTGEINLFPYHSRINVVKELSQKLLGTTKQFIRFILFLGRCESRRLLIRSLSDTYLFFRYRFWQVLFFEPVNMPREGWPAFLRTITDQVVDSNIRIINDSVRTLTRINSRLCLKTLDGLDLHADLVIIGQSTLLQDVANSSHGPNIGMFGSQVLKRYPHFLVEIIGLTAKLEIPSYIHLPKDPIIHRITTSFKSDAGYHCLLVQSRVHDLNANELRDKVLEILNLLVARIYPDFSSELDVFIHDKYEPLAIDLEKHVSVNPGFSDGILVLRTIGDLSRNIVCYHDSLFTSK
jgi:hypothetical protein